MIQKPVYITKKTVKQSFSNSKKFRFYNLHHSPLFTLQFLSIWNNYKNFLELFLDKLFQTIILILYYLIITI